MELTRAEKIKKTGILRYGSEEAWRESLSKNGKKGGKAQVAKGFSFNRELAKEAGRKGAMARFKSVDKSA